MEKTKEITTQRLRRVHGVEEKMKTTTLSGMILHVLGPTIIGIHSVIRCLKAQRACT